MTKLPKLHVRPHPQWQKDRLARWLREWRIEQHLTAAEGNAASAGNTAATCTGDTVKMRGRPTDFMNVAADLNLEQEPAEGQIRLVSPELSPAAPIPLFVALLRTWDEGTLLIAPYGRFSEPATTGELITGRDVPCLRVICLWNAHTISLATLRRTWFVDRLTAGEMADAWETFRHVATGTDLRENLQPRIGPPIQNPADPRIVYQAHEVRRMEDLVRYDERLPITQESHSPGAAAAVPPPIESALVFLPWVPAYEEESQLAMAAASHAIHDAESVLRVSGRDLYLHVTPHSNWRDYVCLVADERGEPSETLDGYRVISATGQTSAPITGAQVVVPPEFIRNGFALSDTAGRRVKLDPVK